ncbi:hypothetical protein [Roseovarius aestuariivivens]|uniref:hypothetical protein n=1 Tax=Roseovarius aestuariivivens TaxID=1888910 RepID=UPI001080F37F|nr:hypothetical protein [Roseovarius aestuariivivens]
MDTITSRDLARHAKLFELLRQQNMAKATRKNLKETRTTAVLEGQRFQEMAAQSLAEQQKSL